MTPESEDLDTVAPNSAVPSPPKPHPLVLQPHDLTILAPGDPLEEELRSKLSELVSRANSKDSSSSSSDDDNERMRPPADKDGDQQRDKARSKDAAPPCGWLRDMAGGKVEERAGETAANVNGPRAKRGTRLTKSASVREEARFWETSGKAEGTAIELEPRRGDKRETSRPSKRQHKRDVERREGGVRRSASCVTSPALSPSSQEGALSDSQVRI